MTKFCEVCRQIVKCNYCSKYGIDGIYMYLQQQKYKVKNKESYNLDIHKSQLQTLGDSRRLRS